ncbi:Uncharacterised protein [uncultured archaeon]|nr:Uncharacterised protein [uncultured archaeon]
MGERPQCHHSAIANTHVSLRPLTCEPSSAAILFLALMELEIIYSIASAEGSPHTHRKVQKLLTHSHLEETKTGHYMQITFDKPVIQIKRYVLTCHLIARSLQPLPASTPSMVAPTPILRERRVEGVKEKMIIRKIG